MKNLFFASIGILLCSLALSGCAGGNNSAKIGEDSLPATDSIGISDSTTENQAAETAIEQRRNDSILPDSTVIAEEKNTGLDPKIFLKENSVGNKLKKAGFKLVKTKLEYDEDMPDAPPAKIHIYKRELNGNTIQVEDDPYSSGYIIKFSDPKERDNFLAEAKAIGMSKDIDKTYQKTGAYLSLTQEGNTVRLIGEH